MDDARLVGGFQSVGNLLEYGCSFFARNRSTGEPEQLTDGPLDGLGGFSLSKDGSLLYFQRDGNMWVLSLEDRVERPVTDLAERRGQLGGPTNTNGRYLYIYYREDLGDIWVMDVADESR